MQRALSIILLFICSSVAAFNAAAEDAHLYFSWESLFKHQPDSIVNDVVLKVSTAYRYQVEPKNDDKKLRNLIKKQALIVSVNDSVWLINSQHLRHDYTGDFDTSMNDLMPFYFNSKIAYFQFNQYPDPNLVYMVLNNLGEYTLVEAYQAISNVCFRYDDDAFCYIVDPEKKHINMLDHNYMSKILGPYRQLRMRYESMKYYQYPTTINYYFLDYIDSIDTDDEFPYIDEYLYK